MVGQMKRMFILASVIGFILLAMTACAGSTTETPTIEPAATETEVEEPATDAVVPTDTAEAAAPTATESPATATEAPTDEPTSTSAPTDEPTDEPTPEPTEEPTPEPTATGAPPQPSRASVSIADFQFSPGTLTVSVGTTVVWTNNESARHTVTADDDSFGSDTLSEGGVFEFTFDTPGTYAYYCRFHGGEGGDGMSGVITVTE